MRSLGYPLRHLALLGCAVLTPVGIPESTPLEERVAEAASPALIEALQELGARLEAVHPSASAEFTPAWRQRVSPAERTAALDEVQFFVDDIRETLRGLPRRSADGARGGHDSSGARFSSDVQRPGLVLQRHFANVLVSRALLRPEQTAEGLALALDLAHAMDDDSLFQGCLRVMAEQVVLIGAAEALRHSAVDVAKLGRALDPLLRRSAGVPLSASRLEAGMEAELDLYVAVRERELSGREAEFAEVIGLSPLNAEPRQRGLERDLSAARRLLTHPCLPLEHGDIDHVMVSSSARTFREHRERLRLARMALRLAERLDEGRPAPVLSELAAESLEGLEGHESACASSATEFELRREGDELVLRRSLPRAGSGTPLGLDAWRLPSGDRAARREGR